MKNTNSTTERFMSDKQRAEFEKCAKDEDNYKPERALQWLGVTVIAWCGFFMWWVLS